MLKKLRKKFVLINMIFTMLMLLAVFIIIYFSTSRSLFSESIQMMSSVATNPMHLAPPDENNTDIRIPYFTIRIDKEGNTTEVGGGFYDLSDKELIQKIVDNVQQAGTDNKIGVLKEYNLRYYREYSPDGSCIVFSDMSNEQSVLRSLIRNFIIAGAIAFVLLYLLSTALANWAIKPVETAWNQQKQFVADASHELKTPLTVILTDADLLNADDCTDTDKKSLSENIVTMASQMSGLVEGLLDLARLDSGKVKEQPCDFSFSDIASNTAMIFDPIFFEKGMTFSYEIAPDIIINGNPTHLKQLITIFLDNASKYAQQNGEVKLTLTKVQKKCTLCVSNQGDDINPDELDHLFERFYRADKARTMNHSYGLGLSIADGIVSEHHGRIWAESKNGYNSFYAELPVK